ncbi:MAG: hypothetical protein GF344_14800 [Chitinivibrionales bacterium]|nr:hypothetical protein [Chitinivibrionales bacterium]MBD3357979.1 hypothetical protein [Chitinivibrionales bacterium]
MKRIILGFTLSLTSLIGLNCSDSFEPTTSLGQDVLGIDPEGHFASFSQSLAVGTPRSTLGPGTRTDNESSVSGLHETTPRLAAGTFIDGHGSATLTVKEKCVAYVEFNAQTIREVLEDSTTIPDSIVVTFTRDEKDSTCGPQQARLKVGFPSNPIPRNSPIPEMLSCTTLTYHETAVQDSGSLAIKATFPFDTAGNLKTRLLDTLVNDTSWLDSVDVKADNPEAILLDVDFPPFQRRESNIYLPMLIESANDSLVLFGSSNATTVPRPYIDLFFRTSDGDTSVVRHYADYSSFTVREAEEDTASLADMAYSSAAPGRYAIIPINLSPLWDALDDAKENVRYQTILAASVEMGVEKARWCGDSLLFTYYLGSNGELNPETLDSLKVDAASYQNSTAGENDDEISSTIELLSQKLPLYVKPGMTFRLSVSDMLYNMMKEHTAPPDTGYLYLDLWSADQMGSIKWNIGSNMKVRATFSNPQQG